MRISDWSSDVCSSDLVVVADAAFGHQPRGFVGEAPPAFARARFGVLAGAVPVASRQEIRDDCTTCTVEVDGGLRTMPGAARRARQRWPPAARSPDLPRCPTLPRPPLDPYRVA